jgi:hypothetical protein
MAARDGMGLPVERVDCWATPLDSASQTEGSIPTLSALATGGDFKPALAIRHPNVRIDCRQAALPRLPGGSHPGAVNAATAASTAFGS